MKSTYTACVLFLCVALAVPYTVSAQSLENYCKDGFYQIPGEKKCSRAPHCGGYGYEDLNKADLMPNNNDCLDEGRGMVIGDPPRSSAFYGYVPLCCYEMERLKNPEMCIGYWERLWCHPDQCKAIDNERGCGGGACQCAHAMKGWCEMRNCTMLAPVPLAVRLGQKPKPTVPASPTPLRTPTAPVRLPTVPPSLPTRMPTSPPLPPLPSATPVPFDIGQPSGIPLPEPTLPRQSSGSLPVRSTLRVAIVKTDPLLKMLKNAFDSLVAADRMLERSIEGRIGLLKNSVFGSQP